jgi:signal transduction histidine kinase/ActR/RegA family two-component response regulator
MMSRDTRLQRIGFVALWCIPTAHPILLPIVGAPSHLLWFVHVLAVAITANRWGERAAVAAIVASAALVIGGERWFGAGYGEPADWQTALSLAIAVAALSTLVAGFAIFARRSRRTYETLFAQAPVGVLRVDADGRIRLANDQARRLLEVADAPTGAAFLDQLLQCGRATSPSDARAELLAPGPHTARVRSRPERLLSLEAARLDRGDWQVVLQDISEREELERRMRQSQKLEAIGQFAGTIAHDFNNVAAAILLFAESAIEDLPPEHDAREPMIECRRAAERAALLTRRLLAFARRDPSHPVRVDLNQIIIGLEPMLRRLVSEHVHVATAPAPGLPAVELDPGHLEQILLNLVVNANDAMPVGGALTIETSVATGEALGADVGARTAGSWVVLEISDTGTGIDANTQARIFEPFFTTKSRERGTGLGLATVASLTETAGGVIRVDSVMGQGTTFRLGFPAMTGGSDWPPTSHDGIPAVPGGVERILLAEDEQAVRRITARTLRRLGYSVREARHGRDALESVHALGEVPDLLITDLIMPEMGGRELAETLCADHPGLAVLFMTGYAPDEGILRLRAGAGASILRKPFTSAELASAVRARLDARVLTPSPSA